MTRARQRYALLAAASLLVSSAGPRAEAVQVRFEWVWSGAVTAESAVVKAKVVGDGEEVRLRVGSSRDLTGSRLITPVGGKPDADGVVAFEIDGLVSNTPYYYAVEADGTRGLAGRFHTFAEGPMSFRVVFGSCATTGSNSKVFETMLRLEPLLFVHMGDFHYEDIRVNDPARFGEAFDEVLTAERQAALYRDVSVAYVWDDHDYGPDDADGTSPAKPAALAAYQQYVPHYPLVEQAGAVASIQQAFTAGRVRFIVTDGRSERVPREQPDGPEKSMLGVAQRQWLFDELEAARNRYALIVWVNVVPWITSADPGGEHGWEPYSWERTLIADRIKSLGLVDRMMILSGDAHMVAIDDGTNSNYASDRQPGEPGFPVIHAAPLDRYPRIKGGPYSHGVAAERRLFGLGKRSQFGLMELTDDGSSLDVVLSGREEDGDLLDGLLLRLRCDDSGCRIVDGSDSPSSPTGSDPLPTYEG